jgi:hypothetical protein
VTDLARGAYEHLITRRLDAQLQPIEGDLVRIMWRLREPLPADVFHAARVAAG